MIIAICIIVYIILILFTAWGLHRWGAIEKEDALGWGTLWPAVWFFLLVLLLASPVIWIGQLIIKLWNKIEP